MATISADYSNKLWTYAGLHMAILDKNLTRLNKLLGDGSIFRRLFGGADKLLRDSGAVTYM